ncbi:MAG: ABC transporter substrate-binding protein [Candidatus Limisoma sp.]
MRTTLLYIFIALLFVSCGKAKTDGTAATMDYAKGLTIAHCDGYTRVDVADPWNAGQTLQTYLLVPRDSVVPDNLPRGVVVRTPLHRALVYSDVHARAIRDLGEISAVGSVCDAEYFKTPEIVAGLSSGRVVDCGSTMSPTVERIAGCSPDAVLLSPFQNAGYGALDNLGIPIIALADYMESTPLGRAEWIKFLGLLFDRETAADSIFSSVAERYTTLREQLAQTKQRPKVLTEYVISGVWYVPGGKSYKATLLADAGANYPWSDDNSTGSLSLDFARVLDRAADADYWLVTTIGDELTLDGFLSLYPHNDRFEAFRKRNIYYANTLASTVFEETPFHPDLLLQEYGKIFHPEMFPDYQLRYFRRINTTTNE